MVKPRVRNLGLKLLSVALATFAWVLVSGEQVVERVVRIPLEFTNLPAELEVVGDAPAAVDVRVRGSSGALSRAAVLELVAVLDLQLARPGQRLFRLSGADVRAPFGVEVVQITPSTVSIGFESLAMKIVPVVPEIQGEPADGYALGTVTVAPSSVEVFGVSSAIESLSAAMTEPVSVAGATGPITATVNVSVVDAAVRLQSSSLATVTVDVFARPAE